MLNFYRPFEEVREEKFDGFIVTGAPVELLDFEEVTYWPELRELFDWCDTHVHSAVHICWGAQAALFHYHGVPKYELPQKRFGVFRHRNLNPASPYLRGFSDDFSIPVSRWTENRAADLPTGKGLEVLMESDEAGLCLVNDPARRTLYMFNHIEYDSPRLPRSITATAKPVSRSTFRPTISPATIRPKRRKTAGAATRTCCSATG
jgi:homoserine O-succinyltransferase